LSEIDPEYTLPQKAAVRVKTAAVAAMPVSPRPARLPISTLLKKHFLEKI
jgi:hypothetical protein